MKLSAIFVVTFLACFSNGLCYLITGIELHHDIGNNEFVPRGNITIMSLDSGLSFTNQRSLSTSEQRELKALGDRNEFYRVRATVAYANGAKQTFLTSSKACSIIAAQLNDILWISVDSTGFVTALTHTTAGPVDCTDAALGDSTSGLEDFNTDVLIRHMELGPMPDTASFIQKVEREREARERGDVRDNRGFFAKYWMYIVPVVLLVFISGATNQEGAK